MLPFGDSSSLISWKIKQLKAVLPASRIYLSSEDPDFLAIARRNGINALPRDPSIAVGHQRPFSDVITGVVADVPHAHVAWCTVVCPLLSPAEYAGAFEAYRNEVIEGEHDSLVAVNKLKEYFWGDDRPVNYRADRNHTISQDLPNLYRVTNGIYMMSREAMMERGYFLGPSPFKFEVSKIAGIDIDYIEDYRMAIALYDLYRQDASVVQRAT
jgi:CMP-N-acetylneuraminic acid synthetase